MNIKNKFEKFLLSLSSIFLLVIVVLGFKIENDNKKIAQILEISNANQGASNNDVVSQTREQILSQAAKSGVQDITQNVAQKTVIPGKVITQKVPASPSSSSSKTTSKKTKTS